MFQALLGGSKSPWVGACGEHVDPAFRHAQNNLRLLFRGLARGKDDLWQPGAKRSMVIEFGEADVLKGRWTSRADADSGKTTPFRKDRPYLSEHVVSLSACFRPIARRMYSAGHHVVRAD